MYETIDSRIGYWQAPVVTPHRSLLLCWDGKLIVSLKQANGRWRLYWVSATRYALNNYNLFYEIDSQIQHFLLTQIFIRWIEYHELEGTFCQLGRTKLNLQSAPNDKQCQYILSYILFNLISLSNLLLVIFNVWTAHKNKNKQIFISPE
jgi:hypothetical protein